MSRVSKLFKYFYNYYEVCVIAGAAGGVAISNTIGLVESIKENQTLSEALIVHMPMFTIAGAVCGGAYVAFTPITIPYTLAIGANRGYQYLQSRKLPQNNPTNDQSN